MSDFLIDEELLAAIDMGSNSFHLAIARVDHGEVKKVASMSEKVQLAAGLDENKNLIGVIGTARDITEQILLKERNEYLMYFDQLTSLPNRQKIILDIENKKAKSSIVFNIDDFKEVKIGGKDGLITKFEGNLKTNNGEKVFFRSILIAIPDNNTFYQISLNDTNIDSYEEEFKKVISSIEIN